MSEKRYFTLDEANAALSSIRPMVERILEIRGSVIEKQPQVWPVLESAAGNGGNIQASQMAFEFNELDGLVHQVQATGAELKDINNGLVDFPAWREGREVYLCWKYGEEDIQFWHELEAGFAGRQAL
jgi:hypothetical protein